MIWAVGDIQGCFKSFKKLLEKINFDPKRDRLWIAGDLVNRGENSLDTLLYLYSIRDSIDVVLGNHDIALIASYYGIKKSNPSIEPILKHQKVKELIDWLRTREFLHIDKTLGYCMVHAGIAPQFDLKKAKRESLILEKSLSNSSSKEWLEEMFDSSELNEQKYSLSTFIRMRFCDDSGEFDFKQKGSPNSLPEEKNYLKPWFKCSVREDINLKIIFGHWSTLGLHIDSNVCGIDTGCVWGGELTAIRIDDGSEDIVQVKCG
jgi:bis(5'-nucleosyl)-tetraphosphatase (symmetrical)